MSKKKDSRRLNAMEIAFNALKMAHFPFSTDKDDLETELDGLIGECDTGVTRKARDLALGLLDNTPQMTMAMEGLSPAWLLELLPQNEQILLRIMLYELFYQAGEGDTIVRQAFILARQEARKLAFQALYAQSFGKAEKIEDFRRTFMFATSRLSKNKSHPAGFAWELALGTWRNLSELNNAITRLSHNWKIDRMGKVEKTLLELALYEMICGHEEQKKIIEYYDDLANQFGAGSAIKFMNGILEAADKAKDSPHIICSPDLT